MKHILLGFPVCIYRDQIRVARSKKIIYLLEAPEMEENDIDNDNIDNNNVNNNAVNNAARIRPTRPRCSPGPLFFFGCVGLTCLLVGSFAMLIAGSYFYSIYNQSSGIEYQGKIFFGCQFRSKNSYFKQQFAFLGIRGMKLRIAIHTMLRLM